MAPLTATLPKSAKAKAKAKAEVKTKRSLKP
jgi:hypothetical protein